MNINRKNQSQFELFPGSSRGTPTSPKSPYELKNLTLSIENIIVLCIVFVMVLVLFFSFGVEKGKRIVKASVLEAVKGSFGDFPRQDYKTAVVAGTGKGEVAQEQISTIAPKKEQRRNIKVKPPQKAAQEDIFTIQVASFKLEKNAKKEAIQLQKKGYDNDIFVLPKGKHSIVCVGKFARKDEAKQFSGRLKNKYNDCLVRRL